MPDGGELFRAVATEAERARELAQSYRNFKVGAAALLVCEGEWHLAYGANFKSNADDRRFNTHAEQVALANVQDSGNTTCRVLAVVGDLQPDPDSDIKTPTLHPCRQCRGAIKKSPLVTPETTIVMAQPGLLVIQYGQIDDYIELHDGEARVDRLAIINAEG